MELGPPTDFGLTKAMILLPNECVLVPIRQQQIEKVVWGHSPLKDSIKNTINRQL